MTNITKDEAKVRIKSLNNVLIDLNRAYGLLVLLGNDTAFEVATMQAAIEVEINELGVLLD